MRHSELTTDLHYARLRTFTGNPATITPDFFDQILTATDTNKVYRATGTNQGQLVELSPMPEQRVIFDETFPEPMSQTQLLVRVDQNRIYRANGILPTDWLEIVGADGGGTGGGSAIAVGNNPPQTAPIALGEQYFDARHGHIFVAIADGANLIWRNTIPPITVSNNYLEDQGLLFQYPDAYGRFFWAYCNHHPVGDVFLDFNNFGWQDGGQDFSQALDLYGAGCYALFYEMTDPNNEVPSWSISSNIFFMKKGSSTDLSPDETCFTLTQAYLLGQHSKGFYISPDRRLGAKIEISAYLQQ
ncbi:hypothetical protein H6F44_11810 [Pseudanabaena sp. FACHB-1277]|uniref:Uncharacterized protein n=1 Tax=Pseudanabaena cinerea FACHB-1277 TaxID=2949581 RepID=A0A926Z6L1_9CYAN|nr:hypothetical protein [Pseudanabaena cinerea]MBD2150800.1 hypothetical protein [Pseudanabaena cinerea FACHB-1277]